MKLFDMETFSNSNNNHSSVVASNSNDGDGDGDGVMENVMISNGEEIVEKRSISSNRINGRESRTVWFSRTLTHRFGRTICYRLNSFNINENENENENHHHAHNSIEEQHRQHQEISNSLMASSKSSNDLLSLSLDEKKKKKTAMMKIKIKKPQFSKQISDITYTNYANNSTASILDFRGHVDGDEDQKNESHEYRRTASFPLIRHRPTVMAYEKELYHEKLRAMISCGESPSHHKDYGGIISRDSCPDNDVLVNGTKFSNRITSANGTKYSNRVTSPWSEFIASHGINDDGDGLFNCVCNKETEFDWIVDLSKLFLGHKFASGTYSKLYLGEYKDLTVAVKILRKPDDSEEIARRLERQFRCEINVLSRVQHPNIVKFVGACEKPQVFCIITEYLALGSLRSYLHNQQPCRPALNMSITMALDIAVGMEYLHSRGVIHRDLKSENLVIADGLCVKITDFGVACFVDPKSSSSCGVTAEDVGTYRWMAPEMISRRQFSKKVDIYSFGIVLWELITGHVPFQELSPVQAAFAVVHKHAIPPIPPDCPEVLSHLMRQCWSRNPSKRPDFTEIVHVLKAMDRDIQLAEASKERADDRMTNLNM